MPVHATRSSCPNCGRVRVRFQEKRPSVYSTSTAYQSRETSRGTFVSSFLACGLIAFSALFFLTMGIVIRGAVGLMWDVFGLIAGGAAVYGFLDLYRNASVDRNPAKGYIDHLEDLGESREALQKKITELEELISRQKSQGSQRAANRLRLLSAALKNRNVKLDLVEETDFIIESKRKIARLEALSQDIANGKNLRSTEQEINEAFREMKKWLRVAPRSFRSSAGAKVRGSLEQAMSLHSDIAEQIEDRLVMRALDGESESEEAVALEQVHDFLEKTQLTDDWNELELEEFAAADEEYLRINAELRLMKDGVTHDFLEKTQIDLEPLDERLN